jgi:SAM-dependent methyltransferase
MMNPAEFANIAKAEQEFWWYRGMRQILFRVLDPIVRGRNMRRVLEAGCGTGYMSNVFHERYGWPMYPIDLAREGLQFGRQLGVERMCQANICDLPFPDAAFDALASFEVVIHLPRGEEEKPMREFARVLAPGGLLVLRVSALDLLRSRHSEFVQERQRFTKRRLLGLVKRHGIRVLRCTYANSLLFPVALAKFRIVEPLLKEAPSSGVEAVAPWLDSLLYAPLAAESRWLGAGLNLPIGQTLLLIGEKERT